MTFLLLPIGLTVFVLFFLNWRFHVYPHLQIHHHDHPHLHLTNRSLYIIMSSQRPVPVRSLLKQVCTLPPFRSYWGSLRWFLWYSIGIAISHLYNRSSLLYSTIRTSKYTQVNLYDKCVVFTIPFKTNFPLHIFKDDSVDRVFRYFTGNFPKCSEEHCFLERKLNTLKWHLSQTKFEKPGLWRDSQ